MRGGEITVDKGGAVINFPSSIAAII